MANTFLTPEMISRRLSLIFATSLGFGASIGRRYDDRFARKGAQIGEQYSIKIPPRPGVTDAVAMPAAVQDFSETQRTMTVDYKHVAANITDAELQMHIDSFTEQIVEPSAAALAACIDLEGTKLYNQVHNIANSIGGGAPSALKTYLLAGAKLTEEGVPNSRIMPHKLCINADQNMEIIDALKGLYHDGSQLDTQYLDAVMRKAAGFDWLYDQNMFLHVCGTRAKVANGADAAVNVAPAEGASTLGIDGLSGATVTVKKGDCFTIANCYAVNPQTGQSTKRLRQFVVLEDRTGISSGYVALKIYPEMRAVFPNKTVSALPADNAAIEWVGASSASGHQALAYHRDAFALAMVDTTLPNGVDFAGMTSAVDAQEWKVSLHVIRDYNISKHGYPCRIGAYFSWLNARPEMACRLSS